MTTPNPKSNLWQSVAEAKSNPNPDAAMVHELRNLIALADDSRVSNEGIGMRVRNCIDVYRRMLASPPSPAPSPTISNMETVRSPAPDTEVAEARIVYIGWRKDPERHGDDERFQAIIEFPDGPPHWPIFAEWIECRLTEKKG